MESNDETNDVNALSCTNCGKEILDKESNFCAYCGFRFGSNPKSSDLTTGGGILAIIAATFSMIVGVFGIIYYQFYVSYYASYGADSSGSIGFLLFLSYAFVSSGVGFAGGMLALAKKRFYLSVLGIALMLSSALFTLMALWLYEYGYPDVILLSGISVVAFSVASAVFVVRSKSEFL